MNIDMPPLVAVIFIVLGIGLAVGGYLSAEWHSRFHARMYGMEPFPPLIYRLGYGAGGILMAVLGIIALVQSGAK